jgi:hypothetical protein
MVFIVAMGLAPGAQAQTLQVHSTGYVHWSPEAILSKVVVSGGECEGEAGKKGRFKYESHRDRDTYWRC